MTQDKRLKIFMRFLYRALGQIMAGIKAAWLEDETDETQTE